MAMTPVCTSRARRACLVGALAALTLTVWTAAASAPAAASPKLHIEAGLFQRFNLKVGFADSILRYDPDRAGFDTASFMEAQSIDPYYSVIAKVRFAFRLTKQFHIVFDLDSGELRPLGRRPFRRAVTLPHTGAQLSIATPGYDTSPTANGASLRQEAQGTFFLRELFVRFKEDREFLFKIGRAQLPLAQGLLYDDSALLVQMGGSFNRHLSLDVLLALPTPDTRTGLESPLLMMTFEAFPERNLRLAVWASYMHDGGDTYAGRLAGWFQEGAALGDAYGAAGASERVQGWAHVLGAGLKSTADLGFFGFDLEVDFEDIRLEVSVVGQAGTMGIQSPADIGATYGLPLPGPTAANGGDEDSWNMLSLGLAATLAVSATFEDEWELKLWAMTVTGDSNPLAGDDGDATMGFTGIRPRLRHTNLFFAGGSNEELISRGHDTLGVGIDDGNGLMAVGANVSYDDQDNGVYVEASVSGLGTFGLQPTAAGGGFYGVEVDLEVIYWITEWMGVAFEYDVLAGGNAWKLTEPMHMVRVGLDISFGTDGLSLR